MYHITEDFFIPVRGGDSGTSIDTLNGLSYDAVDDIEPDPLVPEMELEDIF